MIDALWALAYLLENSDDNFITQVCQGENTVQTAIKYVKSPLCEEHVPALRAIGGILSSSASENTDLFLFN